ncbi:hypothetical protein [Nonomuraea sp. NPDC048826]|uniref:hypothetical protein n=1 Tax=Nonomuraea sp. NPDC048826 TaxID=3364347 RepID=UPI003716DFF8
MRITSIARLRPMRRGSRTVPPPISGTPQRRQNTPNTALSCDLPPCQVGRRLGLRLGELPGLGDEALVEPPDVDDRDPRPAGQAGHVSLVETGKCRPSAEMIIRLAEQLDVPLRERNRLLPAAGFAPRCAERPLGQEALSAAWDAIERVLRAHEPYPALALLRMRIARQFATAPDPQLTALCEELLDPCAGRG